jgi:hypothetical protein
VLVLFSVEGLEGQIERIIDVVEHVACSVKIDGKGSDVPAAASSSSLAAKADQNASNPAAPDRQIPEKPSPGADTQSTSAPSPEGKQPVKTVGINRAAWLGKLEDRVGAWGQTTADGTPDLCFSLELHFPEQKTLDYINLYKCDAAGNRGGEFWYARDFNQAWILGVVAQGKLVNTTPGKDLGAYSGTVKMGLYANDSGIATDSAYFEIEASVGGIVTKKIVSTEPETTEVRAVEEKGVFVAAGLGKHKFSLHDIDASDVKSSGLLKIDIEIGGGIALASVNLFGEAQTVPAEGVPVSLKYAYDLAPGTKIQIMHRFLHGEKFRLGFGGSWASPEGSTNTYAFRCSIQKDQAGEELQDAQDRPQTKPDAGAGNSVPAEQTLRSQNGPAVPLPNVNGRWESAAGNIIDIALNENRIQTSAGSVKYTYTVLSHDIEENTMSISARISSFDIDMPPDYPDVLAQADAEAVKTAADKMAAKTVTFIIRASDTGALRISSDSVDISAERFVKL